MSALQRLGGVVILGAAAVVLGLVVVDRAPPGPIAAPTAGAPASTPVAVASGGPSPSAAAEDARSPARATVAAPPLALTVDDALTGRPIAGAEVRLLGLRRQELRRERTDAEGGLHIDRPAGWGGRVLVVSPGYRPRAWRDAEREPRLSLEPLDSLTVEVDGVPPHLLRHAEIRARFDYGQLRVMPGSIETLSAYEWYRDSDLARGVRVVDGSVHLPRAFLRRAQVEILAEHPPSGWRHRLACCDVLPETTRLRVVVSANAVRDTHFAFVRLNAPERVGLRQLELHGTGPGQVRGSLRRASAAEPFTGWAAGLVAGRYDLVAQASTIEFHLGPTEIEGVTEILRQIGGAELRVHLAGQPSAAVTLNVLDTVSGRAPQCQVERLPYGFRVSGLSPGRYELRVASRSFMALPAFVDVATGSGQDVELELLPRAILTILLPRGAARTSLRIVDLETVRTLALPECRRPIGSGATEISVRLPRGCVYGVELTVDGRLLRRDVRIDDARATVDFR